MIEDHALRFLHQFVFYDINTRIEPFASAIHVLRVYVLVNERMDVFAYSALNVLCAFTWVLFHEKRYPTATSIVAMKKLRDMILCQVRATGSIRRRPKIR